MIQTPVEMDYEQEFLWSFLLKDTKPPLVKRMIGSLRRVDMLVF